MRCRFEDCQHQVGFAELAGDNTHPPYDAPGPIETDENCVKAPRTSAEEPES